MKPVAISARIRTPQHYTYKFHPIQPYFGVQKLGVIKQSLVVAQKGFGSNQPGETRKKGRKPSSKNRGDSWAKTCNIDDFDQGRKTKAVILGGGQQLMMYKVGDQVYCSEAASTAFQYPLSDANIIQGENGPIVESKLDGTQYELETGKVVKWCPQDNLLRKFLGTLKSSVQPKDLVVYPVDVDENGDIYADMLRGQQQ